MPNVRASSGMIGTTRGAEALVAGEVAHEPRERHRRRDRLVARAGRDLGERGVGGQLERTAGPDDASRDGAVEHAATLDHVLVLDRVGRRPVVRRVVAFHRALGDLRVQVQAVAHAAELLGRHLLDLVGGVATLDLGAERPALDRLGEDDGGGTGALVLDGGLVGGVELAVVVAAAGKQAQLVVGQVLDEPAQAGVGTEEVLADVVRPTRPCSAGTRRRRWCSSCSAARRRRRGRGARPTSSPRSP